MTINVVSFEQSEAIADASAFAHPEWTYHPRPYNRKRYPGARKYSADAMATFEFYVVRVADERGHWIGVL